MTLMTSEQKTSSHGKLLAVVIAAALVIVLALLSAFVWPGWAMNKGTEDARQQPVASNPAPSPSVKAKELPQDASPLLKAMPDNVLSFARTEAAPSANWTAASPLEEYSLTYSTGNMSKDVTLVVAQWAGSDAAQEQYEMLAQALKGQDESAGAVKVSGASMGRYLVKTDENKGKTATVIWRNDTAVFQATGSTDSIKRFYPKFPL
jgi:hypothetical protein